MTSEINFETIDGNFPVAGVDNDTQGFRDNFSIIKNSLGTAKTEISDLQNNTARKDENNNFTGNSIIEANLQNTTFQYTNLGTKTFGDNISFLNGHYQSLGISSDGSSVITFNFSDWPQTDQYCSMRVELRSIDNDSHTIEFTSENSGDILYSDTWPSELTIEQSEEPIVIEAWTRDNGNTVYLNYLGKYKDTSDGKYLPLTELKTILAASSDFADFQTKISNL